jgi:addiction module HigA family antidote
MNARNGMRPVHPGEVLREQLDELGLSANALSKALGVPVNRVTMILNGQRGVSADTALRLARFFGTTPQLWLNLQKTWELRRAEIKGGREIAEQVTPRYADGVPELFAGIAKLPPIELDPLPNEILREEREKR